MENMESISEYFGRKVLRLIEIWGYFDLSILGHYKVEVGNTYEEDLGRPIW